MSATHLKVEHYTFRKKGLASDVHASMPEGKRPQLYHGHRKLPVVDLLLTVTERGQEKEYVVPLWIIANTMFHLLRSGNDFTVSPDNQTRIDFDASSKQLKARTEEGEFAIDLSSNAAMIEFGILLARAIAD